MHIDTYFSATAKKTGVEKGTSFIFKILSSRCLLSEAHAQEMKTYQD